MQDAALGAVRRFLTSHLPTRSFKQGRFKGGEGKAEASHFTRGPDHEEGERWHPAVKVAPEQMGKGGSAYKLGEGDRLDEAPPMQGGHTQSDPSQRAGQRHQRRELEAGPKGQGGR